MALEERRKWKSMRMKIEKGWATHMGNLEAFIWRELGRVGAEERGEEKSLLTCILRCEVRTSSTLKGRTHQWTWTDITVEGIKLQ